MRALLVHSPLVGPSSMRPLADALTDLGWHAAVADPRASSGTGDALSWSRWPVAVFDEITANADVRGDHSDLVLIDHSDLVLIGHSASCLLPGFDSSGSTTRSSFRRGPRCRPVTSSSPRSSRARPKPPEPGESRHDTFRNARRADDRS